MSKPNKPEHKARSGWFGSLLADASDLANRPPKRLHSMQYVGWVNVSGVGPIWATTVLISWLTARSMNRDQDISSPMLIAIPLISLLRIHHQKTATITNLSNQNSPSQNSQDGIVQRKELLSLKNGYHFLCVHPRTHKHKKLMPEVKTCLQVFKHYRRTCLPWLHDVTPPGTSAPCSQQITARLRSIKQPYAHQRDWCTTGIN